MNELKLIEKELVPVYETSTGEKVVNGRELWTVLKSKRQFANWINERLKDCDASENIDYTRFNKKVKANNATMIEYIIKLDIAKEMAMLERNEIGKQVRRYFIKIEKKYKSHKEQPQNADDKSKLTEAKLMNARARISSQLLKLSNVETLSKEYKNILVAKATEVLTGEQLIPLPNSKQKTYSATDIANMFGVSANKIGSLANKNNLKTEQYGEFYRDKSPYSSKEVDSFRYFDSVIPEFEKILGMKVGALA